MSDVKNIWVLKQPVSIEDYDGGDLVEVDGHILLQSEIKELFQPLDIESLTEQLENLLAPFMFMSSQEGYYGLEDNELFKKLNSDDDAKVIVAEVLELIGITTKDKK